jgi:hypothetical protein
MYPLYFVQCYLNNGKIEEGFETATRLQNLYKSYAQIGNPAASLTELVILFSLGVSSFVAGYEEKAGLFFKDILEHLDFHGIKRQFSDFVRQYVSMTPNAGLKALLMDYL